MRIRLQIAKTKTCAVVSAQRRESAVNSQHGRLDKAMCGSGSETVGTCRLFSGRHWWFWVGCLFVPECYYRECCDGSVAQVCNPCWHLSWTFPAASTLPRRLCSWVLVVPWFWRIARRTWRLFQLWNIFLLNYHRLYVYCIIYMEDRRQHARVGDFWEIEVIRLCGRHPKHVINISEQEALCVRWVQCSELCDPPWPTRFLLDILKLAVGLVWQLTSGTRPTGTFMSFASQVLKLPIRSS